MQADTLISTTATSVFQCCRASLSPSDIWTTRCPTTCPPWVRAPPLQTCRAADQSVAAVTTPDMTRPVFVHALQDCPPVTLPECVCPSSTDIHSRLAQWHETRDDKRPCFVDSFFSRRTSCGKGRSRVGMRDPATEMYIMTWLAHSYSNRKKCVFMTKEADWQCHGQSERGCTFIYPKSNKKQCTTCLANMLFFCQHVLRETHIFRCRHIINS